MPRAEASGGFAPWTKTVAAVEKHFGTSVATGLTTAQVLTARARYGYNELDKEAGKPLWKLVLEQFDDPLVKARAPHRSRPASHARAGAALLAAARAHAHARGAHRSGNAGCTPRARR